MSALDDAIATLERLGGRLDDSRSAADRAVDAASDALDAATAFGAETHVATLVQVHDDLADATRALTANGEQARQALDRLLALRGASAGGGANASTQFNGGQRGRSRGLRRRKAQGVFALDVAATIYQNAKSARRKREGD